MSDAITLSSDASLTGCGAVCGTEWFPLPFPDSWSQFHISVKELLPIVMSVHVWGTRWRDQRIMFLCDNSAVVDVINKRTSADKKLMALIRKLVMSTLVFNIDFRAKHIPGKINIVSDAISHFQLDKARQASPDLQWEPQPVPHEWHTWCL